MRKTYAPPKPPSTPPSTYGMTANYGKPVLKGRGSVSEMSMFSFSRSTFDSIEQFLADNEGSMIKVQEGLDLLVRAMILVTKGYAQGRAAGPVAPRGRSVPALANRIPVQRITGAYFAGWTQRRVGNAHWMVYNDAKEAYLIEYGLHQRSRRPVLKMSLIDMLRFISTSQSGERFLDWVLAGRKNSRGQFQSFEQRLGTGFKLSLTAGDLPDRGASNPNIAGPSGSLPG
jgi:hypothetical protein